MSTDATTHNSGLAFAGLAEQAEMVRRGDASPRELVEAALRRIERLDPQLNAFRCVRAERALAEAASAPAGPLHGVPIAVKDNMDVTGELTCHGTGAVTRSADADSAAVRNLRAAGAVIVGKTNLPELAMWGHFTESETHGITRNPWDVERSAGGSSGGNGAAVASGMVPAALGSDGGGSIRIPSAHCGLFGLKPTRDRVPLAPDHGHWHGLTVFGPMARSVVDAALLCDAASGGSGELEDAARREPGRLRIGVAYKSTLPGVRLRRPQRDAVERTAELLRSLGHDVVEEQPRWGQLFPDIMPRYLSGVTDDAARMERPDQLERRSRRIARVGRMTHGRALRRALRREPKFAARIGRSFERADLILMPTIAQAADPVGRWRGKGAGMTFNGGAPFVGYTAVWNATGQPAAAVPAGFDGDGLPLSVQLVARAGEDATLVSLCAQIERARPWAERRPPVSSG
ncbi:MAG: amidase [Thermoleophilaceae bacterium]|nr:amidase [Thermoleophilaceae bacterium]